MIVSTDVRLVFIGNGTTTSFPMTGVSASSADDYVVELQTDNDEPVLQIPWVDYYVTGEFPGEGTIVMTNAPAANQRLLVRRSTPSTQEVDLLNNARLRAQVIEDSLDKLTRRVQELEERLRLTPRVPYHKVDPGEAPNLGLPLPVTDQMLVGVTGGGWEGVSITNKLAELGFGQGGGGEGGAPTFPLLAPDGTPLAPQYTWQGAQTTGLYLDTGEIGVTQDGAKEVRLGKVTELAFGDKPAPLLKIDATTRYNGAGLIVSETTGGAEIELSSGSLSIRPGTGRARIGGVRPVGVDITAPPYNVSWSGGDLAPAVAAAIADGHRAVYVPPGDYVWSSTVEAPPWFRLVGAGSTVAKVTVTNPADNWIKFKVNTDTAYDTDWSKGRLSGFRIVHSNGSGVLVEGHEFSVEDLVFSGGVAGVFALDLLNCNEFLVQKVWIGKGGGALSWSGSGIRLRLDRGTPLGAAVNFGDGTIRDCHIKLTAANNYGIWVDGSGFTPTSGNNKPLINNVIFEGISINAGSSVPPGSIGFYLRQVSRCTFVNVDVEKLAIGFKLRSAYINGNSGSNQYNSFINCYVLNCTQEWLDVGDTEDGGSTPAGSLRNNYIGCFFAGPAGNNAEPKYGFQNDDENGNYDAKRSPIDLIFAGTTWYTLPSNGQMQVGLRCSQQGRFYLVGDINYSPNPGAAPYDGMPKNDKPRKAIGFDFGINEVRIYKPWGTAEGTDARITIGNGQMDNPSGSGSPASPLHHIKLADPVYIERIPAGGSLPSGGDIPGYGGNVPDVIVNVSDISPLGSVEWWQGAGLYSKHGITGVWMPVIGRPGWMVAQTGRVLTSYTVDATYAGKFFEHKATSPVTLTLPSNLIQTTEANNVSGKNTCFWFIVHNRSSSYPVNLTPGTGVVIYDAAATGSGSTDPYPIDPGRTVMIIYVRTGTNSARAYVIPFGT